MTFETDNNYWIWFEMKKNTIRTALILKKLNWRQGCKVSLLDSRFPQFNCWSLSFFPMNETSLINKLIIYTVHWLSAATMDVCRLLGWWKACCCEETAPRISIEVVESTSSFTWRSFNKGCPSSMYHTVINPLPHSDAARHNTFKLQKWLFFLRGVCQIYIFWN